uniref:Retrovirus-related Pol polyprotein from transposon RE1 n=1 Tax=Vitis vinifera TaxID=29760 RepID=A5BHV7_VITVI|nr:hypothetical protein VITISV_005824 [Vitis vinifera]
MEETCYNCARVHGFGLCDSSLAAAVATTPFDSGFDPRQRRHLIRAQLVSQLIRVQLKNIQKSRWKISGCFRNHFAGENEVCEISQTSKRAAKYFRNNKLNSQGCEIGFHLEVLSVPACGMYRHFLSSNHYALREDRPLDLTSASTAEQRTAMEKWERSNRMSLMIMKHSILEAIRGAILEETRAKTFLDQIVNQFTANEKVETSTILSKLISMQYKGKENIREYIMEMSNLVTRLKALKLELLEDILVHLVLISLPTQFSPFKISYNTQNEKWTLNEFIQCIQ